MKVGVQNLIAVGIRLDLEPVKREIRLREPPEITSKTEKTIEEVPYLLLLPRIHLGMDRAMT